MNYVKRFTVYAVGMLLLAVGIILNTKTAMGVSPLVSIAYAIATIHQLNFANITLLMYLVHFLIQVAIKRRSIRPFDFLQLPFCFVFTRCMSLLSAILPSPTYLPLRLFMLLLAVLCTGFGVALTVGMHFVPNPADGMVGTIAEALGTPMGLTKNMVDGISVALTILIGLLSCGSIVGVGFGTVCAVLGTGRAVALCHLLFGDFLKSTYQAAPVARLGEQ